MHRGGGGGTRGARGIRGIPLMMTHAVLAPPPRGAPLPALRRGTRVVGAPVHIDPP
jgi:hypothetical protein